jgi:hypothetical protein
MGATVRIERSFGTLDELVLTTAEDMRELGLAVREQIVRETIAGIDADGQAFEPYSPAYAKQKGDALGSSGVNLQVSGNMLNQLQIVAVEEDSVTLGWEQ